MALSPDRVRAAVAAEQEKEPWEELDQELAQARATEAMYRRGKAPLWGTQDSALAELGPGVALYFYALKILAWLFLVMTLVAIPLFVLLGAGTRISPEDVDGLGVASVSVGNAGAAADDPASDPVLQVGSLGPIRESALRAAVTAITTVNAAVLAVFALVFPIMVDSAAERVSEHVVAASAYSVHVSGLPPDATTAEVAEHFSGLFGLRKSVPQRGGCLSRDRHQGHAYERDTAEEREAWRERRGRRQRGGVFVRGTSERVTNVAHVLEPRGAVSKEVSGERGPGRGLMMQAVKAAVLLRYTGDDGTSAANPATEATATPGSALKSSMSFVNIRRPDGTQTMVVASGQGRSEDGSGGKPRVTVRDALRLARHRAKVSPTSAGQAGEARPKGAGTAAMVTAAAANAFKKNLQRTNTASAPSATAAGSVGLRALMRARTATGAMWASGAGASTGAPRQPAVPEHEQLGDAADEPESEVRGATATRPSVGGTSCAKGSTAWAPASSTTSVRPFGSSATVDGESLVPVEGLGPDAAACGAGSSRAPSADGWPRAQETGGGAASSPSGETVPSTGGPTPRSAWASPTAGILSAMRPEGDAESDVAAATNAAADASRAVAELIRAQAIDTASCVVGSWVADVELVRRNGALLRRHAALETLSARREREAARARMLEARARPKEAGATHKLIAKLDRKIAARSRSSLPDWDAAPVAGAYVTFEHAESRERCLSAYGAYGPCCGATMRKALRFRGTHRLWAAPAEEPREVIWENAEVSGFGRARRQCATSCAVVCMLLLSFLVVLAVNTGKLAAVASLPSAALCRDEIPAMRFGGWGAVPPGRSRIVKAAGTVCPGGSSVALRLEPPSPLAANASAPGRAAAISAAGDARCVTGSCFSAQDSFLCRTVATQSRPVLQFSGSAFTHCFCRDQLEKALRQHGASAIDRLREQHGEACDDTTSAYAVANGLVATASISIVIVNVVLRSMLMRITALEAHRTASAETAALALKVFLAQFLNTAVVFLLVNAAVDLPSAAAGSLTRATTTQGGAAGSSAVDVVAVLASGFSDFSPLWYPDVGFGIAVAVTVSTLLSHAQGAVALGKWAYSRHCCTQKRMGRLVEQQEVDQLFQLPVFDSSSKYPVVMNVVMVALTFAAGLPVLYLIGLVFVVSTYAVDKACILRCTSRPTIETAEPMRQLSRVIPAAAALHLAVGAWMLGQISAGAGGSGLQRLGSEEAAPMVALLCLFVLAWVVVAGWRSVMARALRPKPPQVAFTGMAYREVPPGAGALSEEDSALVAEGRAVVRDDPYRGPPHKVVARLRPSAKKRTMRAWEAMGQGGSSYFVGASPRYGHKYRSIQRSQTMRSAGDPRSAQADDDDIPPEARAGQSTGGAWTWTSGWTAMM